MNILTFKVVSELRDTIPLLRSGGQCPIKITLLKVKARLNNYHMRIVLHSRSLVGYPKNFKTIIYTTKVQLYFYSKDTTLFLNSKDFNKIYKLGNYCI